MKETILVFRFIYRYSHILRSRKLNAKHYLTEKLASFFSNDVVTIVYHILENSFFVFFCQYHILSLTDQR